MIEPESARQGLGEVMVMVILYLCLFVWKKTTTMVRLIVMVMMVVMVRRMAMMATIIS